MLVEKEIAFSDMDDIAQIAKQYFLGIAETLEEIMARFDCIQYEYLWKIFIDDARAGYYYTHFNFRMINVDISIQSWTNIGKCIFDYMDALKDRV